MTPKQSAISQDFEFSSYLHECIKGHFEHIMHLGVTTWLRIALAMTVVFEVSAFFGSYSFWILMISVTAARNRRVTAV